MVNIENFPHVKTENQTADVTAGQEEKIFFYLSVGLGALSGLLLIALVVSVLFHRLATLKVNYQKSNTNNDTGIYFIFIKGKQI